MEKCVDEIKKQSDEEVFEEVVKHLIMGSYINEVKKQLDEEVFEEMRKFIKKEACRKKKKDKDLFKEGYAYFKFDSISFNYRSESIITENVAIEYVSVIDMMDTKSTTDISKTNT